MSNRGRTQFVACLVVLAGVWGCGGGGSKNSTTTGGGASATIAVAVSASAATIDATNTVSLKATVTNDKNSAGVTWSVSGGGTVTGTTAAATYTAPSPGVAALTVKVTATSVADATKSGSATIAVPAAPGITTSSLAAGAVGTAYAAQLAASGGIPPYTWAVSGGTMPAGLVLGTDGSIAGTPKAGAAGTNDVTFQVTDAGTPNALTTTAKLPVAVTAAPAVTFGGSSLADATMGSAYTGSVAASGGVGPLTHSLAGGALPAGMTISASGAITGTPTAAGTYSITVKAQDGFGDTASQVFSLRVASRQINISAPTLSTGYVGLNYTPVQFAATGGSGTGYTWAVANGSALPNGITLSAGGALGGQPTAAGTAAFSVTVTDSIGETATVPLSMTIKPGITVTTSATLPPGNVHVPYSVMVSSTGGAGSPYLWSVANGSSLPGGLRLQNNGLISGTPTAGGSFNFTLTVTDLVGNTANSAFSISIGTGVMITSDTTLPTTWVGGSFIQKLNAAGGTGNGYSWTLNVGSFLPAGITLTAAGQLKGNPTIAGDYAFALTVKDSGSNTASATFYLTVNTTVKVTSPGLLPDGSIGVPYTDVLSAAGGSGSGYIWTVTSGASALSTLGIAVSTSGVVSGTPLTAGTASFTVSVTDSSLTYGSATFTLTVDGPGGRVSGTVSLVNNCSGAATPAVTVRINTTPPQTSTTDSSGHYFFASVPSGTYTITPSISGPSAVFYPSSLAGVSVVGAAVTGQDFSLSVGYVVSGRVNYGGPEKGPIYLSLNNACGGGSAGTSVSAPGNFTIRGVAPGTYALQAWRDNQGFGSPDIADAIGSTSGVTVTSADLDSVSVTMNDPAPAVLSSGPTLNSISPMDQGVLISFGAITGTNSNGIVADLATSYTVQWSSEAEIPDNAPSYTFKAGGAGGTGVLLLNNGLTGLTGTFNNGTTLYFRAQGQTAAGSGPWTYFGGSSNPTGVTIGAPSGGNTITGTVTSTGINATGPLYVGFYDMSTGQAYAARVSSPGVVQPFTLQVPSGTYIQFAVLDQNNDGMIDPGDVSNVQEQKNVAIAGPGTEDVDLTDIASSIYVTTQHWSQTVLGGSTPFTNTGYGVSFDLAEGDKLPVSVTLISGPNVISPIDMAKCASCGNVQFQYNTTINATVPVVGDTYNFEVTYSDGTSETVTGAVNGILSDFATSLAPSGSTSVGATPTFSWTDPSNAGNYTYSFMLWDGFGNPIWQIPANNSRSGGFDNTVTSIPWTTDPATWGSAPTLPSLTPGATYYWQIQDQDKKGNSAQVQTYYVP